MRSLNLGMLAHVDAGKTSLTERLLFEAGVIDRCGRVDSGNTHTDTLELEQQRGITIQSSVVSFNLNKTIVNLIDTPGHADFISEVERALFVLDAVILVISAVEGIQAQTRILMNTLKQMKKPALIFINKIDRAGARFDALLKEINQQFDILAVPMVQALNIGTPDVTVKHLTIKNSDYHTQLLETLTANDDPFLEKILANDLLVSKADFLQQLFTQTSDAKLFPVYMGSAITGIGVNEAFIGIEHYLPSREPDNKAALSGTVFKIERNEHNEKVFYIDLRSGQLELRNPITLYRESDTDKPTFTEKFSSLHLFDNGNLDSVQIASAGRIVQATGLISAKIGDTLNKQDTQLFQAMFSRPLLETTVSTDNPENRIKLFKALKDIAEQDPLVCLQKNSHQNSIHIHLYGEVQKEILQQRLATEYGLEALFSKTTMMCIERVNNPSEAVNIMDLHNAPLEFYATLGFRIEPGKTGSGIQFDIQAQKGKIPKGYFSVIEDSVYQYLKTGLHGWSISDCIVTVIEAGVCPLSIAPHFRQLTPILLQEALEKATTRVCEPYSYFELDMPLDLMSKMQIMLSDYAAKILNGTAVGELYRIKGEVFTKHLHELQTILPGLTHGRGVLTSHHAGYR
ncbi:MAG: TetM/TetW/TetO/TetS family tetracycline resistance ribosomal protection protein [Coxiellaceae bacterium]|nr:TetM/TetW/TetO/TetS family tetracycline resistance ribosomal protection protein [Coxiellaceae bacterium]